MRRQTNDVIEFNNGAVLEMRLLTTLVYPVWADRQFRDLTSRKRRAHAVSPGLTTCKRVPLLTALRPRLTGRTRERLSDGK